MSQSETRICDVALRMRRGEESGALRPDGGLWELLLDRVEAGIWDQCINLWQMYVYRIINVTLKLFS